MKSVIIQYFLQLAFRCVESLSYAVIVFLNKTRYMKPLQSFLKIQYIFLEIVEVDVEFLNLLQLLLTLTYR